MRGKRIVFGMVLAVFLAGTAVFAQSFPQGMRGRVKAVAPADIFGACNGQAMNDCRIRYEYWSDETNPGFPQSGSAQVNRGDVAQGVPAFVMPTGAARGDYRSSLLVAGNYPGALPGKRWYGQWYAYQNPGTPAYVGYYSLHGQIVDFGEFGNDNSFLCVGTLPIACFPPFGPPLPFVPEPNRSAPAMRAGGAMEAPLGGFSPIPIPRVSVDRENLLINLEWDSPVELIADGADSGLDGFQLWIYHDGVRDGNFDFGYDPLDLNGAPYSRLARLSAGSNSFSHSLLDIVPGTEVTYYALQLLYRSTPNPNDAFARRSGYALVNLPGSRVEGMSAASNGMFGIQRIVDNFACAYDGGNRVLCNWDVPEEQPLIDHFEVLAAKSVAGLDIGTVPPVLASGTLVVDYDPSLGPGQTLSALDRNAGRTGSKINVYILKAVFTDGTFLLTDPVIVDLTDVL